MASCGLLVLREEDDDTAADIVFVHGLRGDRLQTWTKDGVCWPQDLLPQDLPDARILSWGYDSTIAKVKSFSSQASIFGHAENLLNDLARIRKGNVKRPLLFVGHSLGGLILKEALIRSSEYFHNHQNERLGMIYQCTSGVVFFGTPHRGSPKAGLGHLLASIAKVAMRQPNPHLINSLDHESDVLEHQRASFASISSKMSLVCLYEEEPMSIGIVVPQTSAVLDGFNVTTAGVPANHMDMCKFTETTEIGYARASDQICTLVEAAKEQQRLSVDKLHRSCEDWILEELSFPAIDERYDGIEEAHKRTCQWIFTDESHGFVNWLCNKDRIFWISGDPAAGKSTLMKYVFNDTRTKDYLTQWAGENLLSVAGFFFYDQGLPLQKSVEGLLQSILLQVLQACRELVPLLFPDRWSYTKFMTDTDQELDKHVFGLKELYSTFERLGQQTLRDLRICLFIDGLDEFSGRPEDAVAAIEKVVSSSAGQHTQIKACVSSRPYIAFEHGFRGFLQLKVQDLTRGDILRYVTDKLQECYDTSAGPSHRRLVDDLISDVVSRASGVFLWVSLVTNLLIEGLREGDTIPELNDKLESLPSTLEGLYLKMLKKIKPGHLNQAAALFSILLHAERGINTVELSFAEAGPQEALTLHPCKLRYEEVTAINARMVKRLISRCMGLVKIAYGEDWDIDVPTRWTRDVSLLHKTVKDFLAEPQPILDIGLATPPGFSPHMSLLAGALACIKRIEGAGHSTSNYVTDAMYYAREAESWTAETQVALLDELDRVMTAIDDVEKRAPRGQHWSTLYSKLGSGTKNLESIHWESNFMSYAITERLLEYVGEKRRTVGLRKKGRPLLFYALIETSQSEWDAREMRMDLIRLLLCDHSNVNKKFRGQSVWQNMLERVQSLESGRFIHGPNGILEALTLFLEQGADPNAIVDLGYFADNFNDGLLSKIKVRLRLVQGARKIQDDSFDKPHTPLGIVLHLFGTSKDPRALKLINQLRAKGAKVQSSTPPVFKVQHPPVTARVRDTTNT